MDIGHLSTYVPSVMPNHFNGGKEEMFTMYDTISLVFIQTI